ncbi:MAG: radical SAM protein [Candidatus Latescibacterota bacterium]|nr:MAG: radical SAM protein [Candidatus Latescibacterota bacterium]
MVSIQKTPNTREKLSMLSRDSQYDLACACGSSDADRRHRSKEDKWIYPVALPNGRKTFLLKTLISNVCVSDCKYCPLRAGCDPRRCTLEPEALVKAFFEYYRARRVQGIFLSSGIIGTPDRTMERINAIAELLRKKQFKGYIHLKVIPGASDAAIEQAVSLASAVSINIETAGEKNFNRLTTTKDYLDGVIHPLKLISRLTGKGAPYSRVNQTTQFIVGASDETDREIVRYSWGLYKRLGLSRIYFSAYQRGLGEPDLPGERSVRTNDELLTREHRLYQTDFLIRRYGFQEDEIPFEPNGNLSLAADPKEVWAKRHPEFFPVDVNRAGKYELLRVPGFGPITVGRILQFRKNGGKIRSVEHLGKPGKRLRKADEYVQFGY